MKIGVLSIQGDFQLHKKMLDKLKIKNIEVRTPRQMETCDGLIIPGGESTTFVKLLKENDLYQAISGFAKKHPVMGTCAGLITIGEKVKNYNMETLHLIDIDVERNAYGRQIDSFIDTVEININGEKSTFEGVFIRAPKIARIGEKVRAIGFYHRNVVMAETETILVSTFHPELTDDTRIHRYFIEKVRRGLTD